MNRLGLSPAARREPFHNLGMPGIEHFLDLTIDGDPLLPMVEAAIDDHVDVVSPLTDEFPSGAVDFIEALLGWSDRWTTGLGETEGEVPLHVCPIDYDLWCGAILATVTRDDETVRITRVRRVDGPEDADALVLGDLDFVFERDQVETLLGAERARFVEAARHWTRPDDRVSSPRRWARRVRRRLQR